MTWDSYEATRTGSLNSDDEQMTITEISIKSLRKALGKGFSMRRIEDIFFDTGLEIESYDEDTGIMKIEVTPDRNDLLSTRGVARLLKQYSGDMPPEDEPSVRDSTLEIKVGAAVKNVRPFIAAAAIRGLSLDDESVRELMQLQEKLHETFCGKRRIASIGLYALASVKFPLTYTAEDPSKIRFRPLGGTRVMSATEILSKQKMGLKYADILARHKKHPIFRDASSRVLSYPPIINSDDLGKVTPRDKSVLIEVTGTNKHRVYRVLNIMVDAFRGYGGDVEAININYGSSKEKTPDLSFHRREITLQDVERVLGLRLSQAKVGELLKKMGYASAMRGGDAVSVSIPFYRHDILHAVDVIDDILRAYGVNEIPARIPNVFTIGGVSSKTKKVDFLRNAAIGLGFDETLTLALTSEEYQYTKMNVKPNFPVRVLAAKSEEMNMVRSSIIPEMLRTLKRNDRYKLPIRIFEVSDVVAKDKNTDTGYSNDTRFAAVMCASDAGFTAAKQLVEFVCGMFNVQCDLDYANPGMFIDGRGARVMLHTGRGSTEMGLIGELHPEVLGNFGIENPVAIVEISLEKLL